jgi:hypothetical protein
MAEEWTKTTSLGFLNHKHDLNEESRDQNKTFDFSIRARL